MAGNDPRKIALDVLRVKSACELIISFSLG